jgi:hypothetical protein
VGSPSNMNLILYQFEKLGHGCVSLKGFSRFDNVRLNCSRIFAKMTISGFQLLTPTTKNLKSRVIVSIYPLSAAIIIILMLQTQAIGRHLPCNNIAVAIIILNLRKKFWTRGTYIDPSREIIDIVIKSSLPNRQ